MNASEAPSSFGKKAPKTLVGSANVDSISMVNNIFLVLFNNVHVRSFTILSYKSFICIFGYVLCIRFVSTVICFTLGP